MGEFHSCQPQEEVVVSLLKYWPSADEINKCVKHEAEGADDAVLLAVHRLVPLTYKEISSGNMFDASEEELFNYLVSANVPEGVQIVPITGASGAGKSHMVRLLNARLQNINSDGKFVIIRIPKSASLRKVVELILEQLPEAEYAQVRAEFDKVLPEDLDVESAVIRFQAGLDIAMGKLSKDLEARVKDNPADSALKELLGHARYLPKFMGDPVLVEHFRKEVFPRFVHRAISGQRQVEQEEFLQDFVPTDFHIPEDKEIDISRSAFQTKAYYMRNLLARESEGMRTATRMLNENKIVDQAIRQLFNLHQSMGGLTLHEVILKIRERLLKQERELVIFVEDFKALIGIQDILLKVLIQEGERENVRKYATLRSVIAVTDGYLSTEDTFGTRAKREWKVETQLSSPDVISRTKSLVAAYLNAARWGFDELVHHFKSKGGEYNVESQWIGPYVDPSYTEDSPVLTAFGYYDNIPLFPFTEAAIEQLAKATLTRNNTLIYTPRFIIDSILRPLLLEGRPAFEIDRFPPPSINAPSMNAEISQWLAAMPIAADARARYQRIVSIWGNSPQTVAEVGYIPKEVFDAFKLDRPNIEYQNVPRTERQSDPTQTKSPVQLKPDTNPMKVALEKWVQGERMPQSTASQIRQSLASALNERIDWVAERCLKSPIPVNRISIPNSAGEGNFISNLIRIAEDDKDPSGLLRLELTSLTRLYSSNVRKISYDGADEDLVLVGNLVDRLMPQALSIVRAEMRQKLGAAIRLLQINSQILGLSLRGRTTASLAPFLFGEAGMPPKLLTGANSDFNEWSNLQEQAVQIRPTLIELVTSFCGSFQGYGKIVYAIDMTRVLNTVLEEEEAAGPNILDIPSELKQSLAKMSESRLKLQARNVLKQAVVTRNKLLAELGENFDKQAIVEQLKALADQLGENGAWRSDDIGMGPVAFKNRCDEFRNVAIRETLSMLSSAENAETELGGEQLLSRVGRLDLNPLIVAASFTETARKVIEASEKQASVLESKYVGVDPQQQAVEIQELLQAMINKFDSFSSGGEAP